MAQPSEEQLDLIKSCIVQHPDYDPKKCRMSELVNLVFEKSSMFMNSIANENTVRKYILKIVGENLEKCNVASDIAQIQEAQESFLKEAFEEQEFEDNLGGLEELELDEPIETAKQSEMNRFYKLEGALEEAVNNPPEIDELEGLEELQFEELPVEPTPFEQWPPQTPQDLSFEESFEETIEELPSEPPPQIPLAPQEDAYKDVVDPLEGAKTKKVSKELTEKVIDIVRFAHSEDPSKQYFKIFYLKYIQKMRQSDIALQLSITEEELCDRYLKLVRIVKNGLRA